MTVEYSNALAEVDYILEFTSKSILKKIPKSFIKFIKNNKNKDYKVSINKDIPITKQPLKDETRAIMSLIYRSYLCTDNQKKRLKIDDMVEMKKQKKNDINDYKSLFKKYN